MDLLLLTCADSGVVDATTNRLSVFQILEELSIPTFPFAMPRISVISMVSRTRRERERPSAEFLITLDKKTLVQGPWPIDFQTQLKTRNIGEVQGLVIPAPGTLRFELRVRNKPLGEWRVLVRKIEQAKIVPKPPPPKLIPPVRLKGAAKPAREKRKKR